MGMDDTGEGETYCWTICMHVCMKVYGEKDDVGKVLGIELRYLESTDEPARTNLRNKLRRAERGVCESQESQISIRQRNGTEARKSENLNRRNGTNRVKEGTRREKPLYTRCRMKISSRLTIQVLSIDGKNVENEECLVM